MTFSTPFVLGHPAKGARSISVLPLPRPLRFIQSSFALRALGADNRVRTGISALVVAGERASISRGRALRITRGPPQVIRLFPENAVLYEPLGVFVGVRGALVFQVR